MPIDYLNLELRNEDQIGAAAVGMVTGPLTRPVVEGYIGKMRELLTLIDGGLEMPICPELTNANPSSPHTVLLYAITWVLSQQADRINQIPKQTLIAFANLFGIEQKPATPATTTLRFTIDAPTNGTVVTIPAGVEVVDETGSYIFTTVETKNRTGDGPLDVKAERSIDGPTLLSPNQLTLLIDVPAFVTAVTNPDAVDSGSDLEPLDQALERVRVFQRRGSRIVTDEDLEDALLNEGLLGNGVVRAFEYIVNGDYSGDKVPGHTTVVVMTRTGDPIDAEASLRCSILIGQVVGNQFVYLANPNYIEFDIEAVIRLNENSLSNGVAVQTAVEQNLRNFYAAARENFGRGIYRSEIVAVIEGTAGVDRIVANGSSIIALPAADMKLAAHQLPKLVNVTIGIV